MKYFIHSTILFFIMFSLIMPGFATNSSDGSNSTESTELSTRIAGKQFTYKYSGGWKFEIKYQNEGVSYRMLNYNTGWKGPFKYQAFEVSEGVFFTGWFDSSRGDYITHYIDFKNKKVYGSVLLANKSIHFQSATISKIEE